MAIGLTVSMLLSDVSRHVATLGTWLLALRPVRRERRVTTRRHIGHMAIGLTASTPRRHGLCALRIRPQRRSTERLYSRR